MTYSRFQFAYKKDRSTKDPCIAFDHHLRSHLDQPSSYTRILFVDFTSAFNTIVPNILLRRLKTLGSPFYLRSVVKPFLVDRQQFVRIGDTGCPQGCVLSPILFSIYTDFMRETHTDIKISTYVDDTAVVGLLNFKDSDTSYLFSMPYRPL